MYKLSLLKKSLLVLMLSSMLTSCETKENIPTQTRVKLLVKSMLKEMVYVKGGSFGMGNYTEKQEILAHLPKNVREYMDSKEAKDQHFFFMFDGYEQPRHKVTLSGYNIAKFETSWGEFDLYTQAEKLPFVKPALKKRAFRRRLANKSANLGWHQADRYCKWLAKVSGLPFALPTEAQWEYAATNRGEYIPYGTDTGYWQRGVNVYSEKEEEKGEDVMSAKDTKYPPNPLGIYHLADSMSEWTSDWFTNYTKEAKVNPKGPKMGTQKTFRGACWDGSPQHSSNWSRYPQDILLSDNTMKDRSDNQKPTREDADGMAVGVRCVLNLDRPITQKDIDGVK